MAVLLAPQQNKQYDVAGASYASDSDRLITVTNSADYVALLAFGCVDFPINAQNSIPGIYNFDPRNSPNLRKGLANVRAAISNLKIACVGDSTTFGEGANTQLTNIKAFAYPAKAASILNAAGLPATAENFFGNNNNPTLAQITASDPRLVFTGTGWTFLSTTPAGASFGATVNDTTSNIAFTPNGSVDSFDIYYLTAPGNGTFSTQIDSSAATNVSTNAANAVTKTTVTTTLGAHTLNLKWVSGTASAFILGVSAYNSATKCAEIWNLGARSWTAADWAVTTNFWSPLSALKAMGLHLALINLTINDRDASASPTAAMANLQTIITGLKSVGTDVWLINPHPTDPSGFASQATQAAYLSAMQALAAANNCVLIDLSYPDQTFAAWNALGFSFNALHPNGPGYGQNAQRIAQMLLRCC